MGQGTKKQPARRVGGENSASRAAILDAAERLMHDEGYGSVSTRRVAAEAGLKPSLVHYYFPTTDDMLLALYRRGAELSIARLEAVLASDRPLHALWRYNIDQTQTAGTLEFMALAGHRKVLRAHLAEHGDRLREMQTALVARIVESSHLLPDDCPPGGLSLVMSGIARALVMEGGLGISSGHAEARAFVEWWIDRLEPEA
jgi:AcrR family transcriptional regulator